MSEIALPRGHHYAVMWGIPDNYAGMTNSMLHRSRAFVELTGTDVTIVTYEHRDDYDVVRKRLRDRGGMVDGMHIANLWEDLRGWDDEQLKQAEPTFDPGVESTFEPLGERGDHTSALQHVLGDGDDIDQVDYFRADGTLLASDRRRGREGGSGVHALRHLRQPARRLADIWDLYYCWLDSLPRDPVAWFIVDSKTSANHLVEYHRDDVVTLHVVHASHLEPADGRPMGTLGRAGSSSWSGSTSGTASSSSPSSSSARSMRSSARAPTGTSSRTAVSFPRSRRPTSARSDTA